MRNDYCSNYLMHHGILGMKWGVKNGPPYPLDASQKSSAEKKQSSATSQKRKSDNISNKSSGLTDKQKLYIKRGAIAAGAALAVVGGVYLYKKSGLWYKNNQFSNLDFNSLSSKVLTITKDTKLQRISSKPIEDYVKQGKSIYASYLERDNTIYKEQMPKFIKAWDKMGNTNFAGGKAYVHKLSLKRDIKIASEKDVVDAYKKAMETDQVDPLMYSIFMRQLKNRDLPMNNVFIESLKSKGYDGMIDLNDTTNNITKSPLLLFDAKDVIDSSTSYKLGAIERFINVMKS